MPQAPLKEYIELYPGIRDFIFAPPADGDSRTWIFSALEEPQTILNFHFTSLISLGWHVRQEPESLTAQRGGADLSVSSLRRNNETRVVYQILFSES